MNFEHDRELGNQARTENGNDTDENGKVDRIRDILFGSQMRDYDERFHRLDERLTREAIEARGEVQKRLEALENLFKREVESMTNRLSTEQSERGNALEIARNLAEMVKALESRINGLGDHANHEIHGLREQLHERSNALSAEIKEEHDQMKAGLEMVRALESRINGLGEHADHEIHGLREQLHERSNALSVEIKEKHDQMKAGLDRETEQIRGTMTGREALAEMLSDVALRLRNGAGRQAA